MAATEGTAVVVDSTSPNGTLKKTGEAAVVEFDEVSFVWLGAASFRNDGAPLASKIVLSAGNSTLNPGADKFLVGDNKVSPLEEAAPLRIMLIGVEEPIDICSARDLDVTLSNTELGLVWSTDACNSEVEGSEFSGGVVEESPEISMDGVEEGVTVWSGDDFVISGSVVPIDAAVVAPVPFDGPPEILPSCGVVVMDGDSSDGS